MRLLSVCPLDDDGVLYAYEFPLSGKVAADPEESDAVV
jgi:hypothetical protein